MNEQKNNLVIPAAIILAGFVIAGGIYLANKDKFPSENQNTNAVASITLNEISKSDHILGDPNAPVVLVEFSDTECPFCKMFQTTMNSVMDTYGKSGKVAWVYRYFPLDGLHKKSRSEAQAVECVSELGGSTAFWKMLDTIYQNTPGNDGLDSAKLSEFAKTVGVDVNKFNDCWASGKYAGLIEAHFQDGKRAGAQGTPYSVLVLKTVLKSSTEKDIQNYIVKNNLGQNITIAPSKKEIALNGALPLEMMKEILDIVLK